MRSPLSSLFLFFFFNDTATTEIYTLSLHDALPILAFRVFRSLGMRTSIADRYILQEIFAPFMLGVGAFLDRKSTRLNSSHDQISYAVFCLKKKKIYNNVHYNILDLYNIS